ncbi:MAG: DUF3291 domain-containing protein [Acidimicrobiia bacterium]|nr:DUF3291 domain-containing protein [Acidimicrobiia bacterium]
MAHVSSTATGSPWARISADAAARGGSAADIAAQATFAGVRARSAGGPSRVLRERRQPILCLWWVPEGTIPTVEDAIARLEHLRRYGPSPVAFTFRHRFAPSGEESQPGSPLDTCPA